MAGEKEQQENIEVIEVKEEKAEELTEATGEAGDGFAFKRIKEISGTGEIKRSDSESVGTWEMKANLNHYLQVLQTTYPNPSIATMGDVVSYLEKKKKQIHKNNKSQQNNDTPTLLRLLLQRQATKSSVALDEVIDDIRKEQIKTSILTEDMIDELIIYCKKNICTSIPVSLTAALDSNYPPTNMTVKERVDNFLYNMYDRRYNCQRKFLGIEAIQGAHPLVPLLLDEVGVKDCIAHFYDLSMKEYLIRQGDFKTQLNLIRQWFEKSVNGELLFNNNTATLILDETYKKFINANYFPELLRQKNSGKINPLAPYLEDRFSSLPPFLARLEQLSMDFNAVGKPNVIWEIEHDIAAFEKHMLNLESKILEPSRNLIKQELILPDDYKEHISDDVYNQVITKCKNESVGLYGRSKKLTLKAKEIFFDAIVDVIKSKTTHEHLEIENCILRLQPHDAWKSSKLIQQTILLYMQGNAGKEEALTRLGNDKRVVYLLYRYHDKKTTGTNVKQACQDIIYDFITKNKVEINQCYGVRRWIKNNPTDKLQSLLTIRQIKIEIDEPLPDFIFICSAIFSFFWACVAALVGALSYLSVSYGMAILVGFTTFGLFFGTAVSISGGASLFLKKMLNLFNKRTLKNQNTSNFVITPFPDDQVKGAKVFYPLKKWALPWLDIIVPYDNGGQLFEDIMVPSKGIYHGLMGFFYLGSTVRQLISPLIDDIEKTAISTHLKEVALNFAYSFSTLGRGSIEIATFPFIYFIKIPVRVLLLPIQKIIPFSQKQNKEVQKIEVMADNGLKIALKKSAEKSLNEMENVSLVEEKSVFFGNTLTPNEEEKFEAALKLHNKYSKLPAGNQLCIKRNKEKNMWRLVKQSFFGWQEIKDENKPSNSMNFIQEGTITISEVFEHESVNADLHNAANNYFTVFKKC